MHWADAIAQELAGKKHVIATGITPSGPIHIGNMREVITGDLIYRAIKDAGGDATLVYIADNLDPLRKRYPFLGKEYEKYVGMPLCDIPCPCGECENYAEHFLKPFLKSLEKLDIHPIIYRSDELYTHGKFDEVIKIAIQSTERIAKILKETSGRDVPEGWSPFMPKCPFCGKLTTTRVLDFSDMVEFECECGEEGKVGIREGKLVWRVDWPARWKVLNVTVEPFGKDHAAAGGSYDTGARISREIYGYEPPHPVVYEWITLKGKPMSSSKGVSVTVEDMLKVVPPDILRYMIVRVKPEKHIDFDPQITLLQLVDEFEELDRGSREYELSHVELQADIPFRHMITVVQIAKNDDQIFEVLERSGYKVDRSDKRQVEAVLSLASNAREWVKMYAPERMKFEVKERVDVKFDEKEREGLRRLAELFEKREMDAKEVHDSIYRVANEIGMKPSKLFEAIYKVFLGKKYGPRAGWFLVSLPRNFVIQRLKESQEGNNES